MTRSHGPVQIRLRSNAIAGATSFRIPLLSRQQGVHLPASMRTEGQKALLENKWSHQASTLSRLRLLVSEAPVRRKQWLFTQTVQRSMRQPPGMKRKRETDQNSTD
jgi:hypothetical protein